MRKIILTVFIVLCTLKNAEAQWIIQPTGNIHSIRDVEFINRYTGWSCGDNHIYKTTNGGNNWIEQTHPDAYLIQQIFPVNENVVYAVGWWNFMKTTNGGETWTAFFAGGTGQGLPVLEALYFIDENTGWLTGNVVVMKTTNGGNSFIDSMRLEGLGQDVYFKNAMTGIICGESGGVLKTINGGQSWHSIKIIKKGTQYSFRRLAVINDSIVWIGSIPIYKSTDFGNTWDSIGYIPSTNFNVRMYGLCFSSINIGYAAGNMGEMYKTTDGGYSWKRENSGASTSIIYSIDAYTDSIVWASRGNGTIIHTVTGGQTGISNSSILLPKNFILYQNFPNPFNPVTNLEFKISKFGFVSLMIYDMLGKDVLTIVNENLKAGTYNYEFNASNFPSGIYFYTLMANGFIETKQMVLIK